MSKLSEVRDRDPMVSHFTKANLSIRHDTGIQERNQSRHNKEKKCKVSPSTFVFTFSISDVAGCKLEN